MVVDSTCGVVDWLVDGASLDEVTSVGAVESVEEGDKGGCGSGAGSPTGAGGLVTTRIASGNGALVTVAPSEGAAVITCSVGAGSSA